MVVFEIFGLITNIFEFDDSDGGKPLASADGSLWLARPRPSIIIL